MPPYKEGATIINESMAIVQWLEVAHPEKLLMLKGQVPGVELLPTGRDAKLLEYASCLICAVAAIATPASPWCTSHSPHQAGLHRCC